MIAPTIEVVVARVDIGVAWLDRYVPNWLDHVNPATLDLRAGFHCVLGQALAQLIPDGYQRHVAPYEIATDDECWETYGAGHIPQLTEDDAIACGFLAAGSIFDPTRQAQWSALTEAWQRKIIQLGEERS